MNPAVLCRISQNYLARSAAPKGWNPLAMAIGNTMDDAPISDSNPGRFPIAAWPDKPILLS